MKLLNSLYVIKSTESDEDKYVFNITLDEGHFIYKAHFPGEPITPGVCIMQIAKELLEEAIKSPLNLTTVKNIKFLKIISPNEVTDICYTLSKIVEDGESVKVQVSVTAGGDIYAKLSLVCQRVQ